MDGRYGTEGHQGSDCLSLPIAAPNDGLIKVSRIVERASRHPARSILLRMAPLCAHSRGTGRRPRTICASHNMTHLPPSTPDPADGPGPRRMTPPLRRSWPSATTLQDLRTVEQLPVEIELGPEFVFRSIFACPVSRDMSTPDNPPMLLPCGHVLCEQSVNKLAKTRTRPFKCPYCPQEARLDMLKPLTFPGVD